MKKMHLLCNAHIDPVWQWEWEEGVGAAISTFRVAAELCEQYDNFVFNHNEAILYQWIEEYEPALFAKIQKLVGEGKWHIMGGWYLQPDCTLPNGESFTRQITEGLSYFKEKFGVRPTVAINFDPFGHTKGMVQIMEQCGYVGYIITRPPLENPRFVWKGFNGSKIPVIRLPSYNSLLGKAEEKLTSYITDFQKDEELGVLLWGVGNHGGGPSKKDLADLEKIIDNKVYDTEICHSTPEQFFADLQKDLEHLPVEDKSLEHVMVGCYTSQVRIKQKHRLLESELIVAEKMAVHAASLGLMDYPHAELKDALHDLLFAQFHDILPGSSIQKVEDDSLRVLDHGLEICSRVKGRAFFKLSAGQVRAKDGELPILVYNPLPLKVKRVIAAEFMLADINHNENEYNNPIVYQGETRLPCQPEKESSNIPLDWRKKVVFEAELEPLSMNRFDVKLEIINSKPTSNFKAENGYYNIENSHYNAKLNAATGLLDSLVIGKKEYLKPGAGKLLVVKDNEDPWGMQVQGFTEVLGEFALVTPTVSAKISGVKQEDLSPVRVIEDGEVRTVIEAVFTYNESQAVIRYTFPKKGSEIGVNVRTIFIEKDKMLKLSIPTVFSEGEYLGKTAFGIDDLRTDGNEVVAQDFVVATDRNHALSVINTGTYGSSCEGGEIRMSLVRTPAYCAHPVSTKIILPQNRYTERIDQGERLFDFFINASDFTSRINSLEKESMVVSERPMVVCFFPPEVGEQPAPLCEIDNTAVKLSALKTADDKNGFIVRLFNSDLITQKTKVTLAPLKVSFTTVLNSFEVKTYRIINGTVTECSLCEEEC